MFFLDGEYSFQHSPGSRIVVTEVIDHLAVTIDGNALSDEIFLNHVGERGTFDVLRVTAHQQSFGVEIRFPLELNYSLGDLIRMSLFVVSVFEKLRRRTCRMNA